MSTLAQFRTAVSARIGLDNSVSGDQPMIDNFVNEAVTDILMRTECQMRSAVLTMTAGVGDYTLDTSILKVYSAYVSVSGIAYWLEVTTVDELLAMRRTTTANVSPAQFYAVGGSDLILIYPTPLTNDILNMYYIPRPTVLSASSDSPTSIPSEFHKAIEYYAAAQAADFSDDMTSQGGQTYLQQYELWIRRINKWVWMKGAHRLPRAVVRRNLGTIPFHDRSRYPGWYA